LSGTFHARPRGISGRGEIHLIDEPMAVTGLYRHEWDRPATGIPLDLDLKRPPILTRIRHI
jgi:hypothetical protein